MTINLDENKILLNQEVKDWREAIAKVAEPLLKEGNINENYISAMINTVENYGPYIVIAPHLALAHARPEEGVIKLGLSVVTLKQAVVFGNKENDPVKIIFCLAAPDSESHVGVIRDLIKLIDDSDKMDQLIKIKDKKQFIDLLIS